MMVIFKRSGLVQGWLSVYGQDFHYDDDVLVDGSIYKVPVDCKVEAVSVTASHNRSSETKFRFYVDSEYTTHGIHNDKLQDLHYRPNQEVKAGATLGIFFESPVTNPVVCLKLGES